jgi:uncharacterized protein involved in exopolysaccharide biosynthesis
LDPSRVIETLSRLLRSKGLAKRVVQQLGTQRLEPVLRQSGWLPRDRKGTAALQSSSDLDLVNATLLQGLNVVTDSRAYLITVRYRTAEPELSISIVNGFVAELLRSAKIQVLSQQKAQIQAALSNRLGQFGEKHPKVAELRALLTGLDRSQSELANESSQAILQAAGESITMATAEPSGPTASFVIGVALLVGFALGIGLALWLERRRWLPHVTAA